MYDENEVLRDAMKSLTDDVPPMPAGLHERWMREVEEDAQFRTTKKTTVYRTVTRYLSIAAALVFVIGGTLLTRDDLLMSATDAGNEKSSQTQRAGGLVYDTSYANSMNEDYAAVYDEAAEAEDSFMLTMGAAPAENGVMMAKARSMDATEDTVEKKIIRTASMTIATMTYEDSLNGMKAACEALGGWIESASESVNSHSGLRTAYLTMRVPQTGLDGYLLGATEWGRITRRDETATDVTESYRDTRARLDTQLSLMERWQTLLTECEDFNDLLTLETQIAETQYEIDRLQSSLNRTDRQVTYSTVDITLREEKEVDVTDGTVSLGERIKAAISLGWETFTGFLADAAVFLTAALPFIAILTVLCIVIRIVKKVRK